jgi:hypothetical protein
MAYVKLNAGCLIGDKWHETGDVVEVSDAEAAAHFKAGSGEAAEAPPAGESPPPGEPPPTKGHSHKH